MLYVRFEAQKRMRGLRRRRIPQVAIIAEPRSGDSPEKYMSSVRKELHAYGHSEGWYRREDGARGGWFVSANVAIQELCHEIVAEARKNAVTAEHCG